MLPQSSTGASGLTAQKRDHPVPFVECTSASYREGAWHRPRLQRRWWLQLTCLVLLPAYPSHQLVALTLTANGEHPYMGKA